MRCIKKYASAKFRPFSPALRCLLPIAFLSLSISTTWAAACSSALYSNSIQQITQKVVMYLNDECRSTIIYTTTTFVSMSMPTVSTRFFSLCSFFVWFSFFSLFVSFFLFLFSSAVLSHYIAIETNAVRAVHVYCVVEYTQRRKACW